jgi:hypothetical protein
MEARKNSVIYMGLIPGPNKAEDLCGNTTVTGTMHRGSTVLTEFAYTVADKLHSVTSRPVVDFPGQNSILN